MKQLGKILALIFVATLLVACGEPTRPRPTPRPDPATLAPTATAVLGLTPTQGSLQPTATRQSVATATAIVSGSPTVQPTFPTVAAGKLTEALQNFPKNSSFSYQVAQQGELVSGNSTMHFEAQGSGTWQQGVWRQALTTRLGGQPSTVEYFGRPGELFERVAELVVWRKLAQPVNGPFPAADRLGSGTFQQVGSETIAGQPAARFKQTVAATGMLQDGRPEILGVLAASGLYRAFSADSTATAQVSLWLVKETQLVRYQVEAVFKSGDSTLRYNVVYDYRDFNSTSITVKIPDDLPRQ